MILGFADFEVSALETVGFGRRSSAFAKNGTYSMEFNGDLILDTWHNCVSRVSDNEDPLAEYPGWKWWALGGWLYVDAVPAGGLTSMMLSELPGSGFANWSIGMVAGGPTDFTLKMYHNKVSKGQAFGFSTEAWHWVVWVLNRNGQVELWVDGSKRLDTTSGANAMRDNPIPSYHEVELDEKADVGSSWFWDSMFLQDDFGFENADTPLTLNSDGLRVPFGTGTLDITLAGGEYLRAVSVKKTDTAGGLQFTASDGGTTWDAGYDNYKGEFAIVQGAIQSRSPEGDRWTEANFNELTRSPVNGVYPLIATVEEGAIGVATRYKGLYPG